MVSARSAAFWLGNEIRVLGKKAGIPNVFQTYSKGIPCVFHSEAQIAVKRDAGARPDRLAASGRFQCRQRRWQIDGAVIERAARDCTGDDTCVAERDEVDEGGHST
jgi:hypothetical protein